MTKNPTVSLITRILVGAIVVGVGIWLLLYSYNAILGFGERGDTPVPDLHGKMADEAQSILKKDALSFSVERKEYDPTVPKDHIISQNPDSGMMVKKGRPVMVVVSEGPQMIAVPDLKGLDFREAEVQLQNVKLIAGNIDYVPHSVAQKDVVVDQNPTSGTMVNAGMAVSMTVSTGPPPLVTVPNVVGDDLDYAKNSLKESELELGQIGWKWDDNSSIGTVLTENPAPGQKVQQGSMVSLVVSVGAKDSELPFKQSYITITLPQFQGQKEVTVEVTDQTSTNLVYKGTHSGGEKIRLMIGVLGDSTVQVKLGDEVLSTGKL